VGGILKNIFKFLFNPFTAATWLFSLLYCFAPVVIAPYTTPLFLVYVLLTTALIPYFSTEFVIFRKASEQMGLSPKSQRLLKLSFILILYGVDSYIFYSNFKVNAYVIVLMLSLTTTVAVLLIVRLFWNISIYSAAMSSVIGCLVALSLIIPELGIVLPCLIMLLVSGIMMTIRLAENVHSPGEVYTGGLVGFLVNLIVVLVVF
jgi:hypothetical protein